MSFGILRTNVGLTTNIKIMVDSNDKMSLDSIESNEDLSLDRFKKFKFNKSTLYDDIIPIYYKEISSEIAFDIKNDTNSEEMSNKFSQQFDNLYTYGARNITNNKDYSEEFEYFAPFYIEDKLPNSFIIFRVDGSGIETLTRENFRENIIDKFKVVKFFDLTNNTNIGQWLNLNFLQNEFFPKSPLEIDFRKLEFSKWNGIDYQSGGYVSKSMFMDDILENEKEIFELEKFVFNNFKESKIVFPNILNLSFLYNDEPSTPDIEKKWSLNRYYGFYLDNAEILYNISPYKTPMLRNDFLILENNLLFSPSSPNNPFKDDWVNNRPTYVEYRGEYYLVEKYTETRGDKITQVPNDEFISEEYQTVIVNFYKIISNLNLEGKQNELNKNYGYIENETLIFDDINTLSDFETADVWLIEIDGVFHKLLKQNDTIKINSDYSFKFSDNFYEYKSGSVSKKVNLMVDFNNLPKKFNIYRCEFSDIKDFDNRIVDTEYSKFEYEKIDEITLTDETKMYLDDFSTKTNPKSLDDFIFKNSVVNIPVSSEYTANFETFKINDQGLSDIWNINPVYCRWVFKNSISGNDYPYLMNNSNTFEIFNRTTNPFESDPNRSERNLDYFYTINSSTSSYTHHSLHIEKVLDGNIDTSFKFDKNKYLNIGYDYDYFSYLFDSKSEFDRSNIKKNIKKYSIFNSGEPSTPNITLFRGIEFRMYDVESVALNTNNDIETVNIYNSSKFDNYKFSILLTDGDNGMEWDIIDEWKMGKDYASGSTVLFEDILYTAIVDNRTDNPVNLYPFLSSVVSPLNPKSTPYNSDSWTYSTESSLGISQSIFWSPIKTYDKYDLVYNFGEYYFVSMTSSFVDFWNPIFAQTIGGYTDSSIVLFKGEYYQSMTSSNIYPPDFMLNKTPNREFEEFLGDITLFTGVGKKLPIYWNKIEEPINTKWKKLDIWNPSTVYNIPNGDTKLLVYHNDIVWSTTQSLPINSEPGINKSWLREYSILPDTNYIYKVNDNSTIQLNNRYYIIKSNTSNETLENGITIYINKKWKNVLVNIEFNDNTLPNISNSDRDDLYNDLYKKLTAYNFISAINEFYNKYGFTDYLSYVIIEENGDIKKYSFNNNIKELPHILSAYTPDELLVNFSSLIKSEFMPRLNLNKKLNNGNIDDLSKINWYNNIPIAYTIRENQKLSQNSFTKIFRFSGPYMPLFYEIQLFDKNTEDSLPGNYKFDTTLTEFGLVKEIKIRKINRKGSVLKLKESNNISMYPMVDEFGYNFIDFMIFKSNWDKVYYVETSNIKIENSLNDSVEKPINIGQSRLSKIKNMKKYNL
jgi:hypothetical protein